MAVATVLLALAPFGPSDETGRLITVAFFGVLTLLALAAFLPYAKAWTLRVGRSGVSLSIGSRVHRSLSWNEVKTVQYGTLRLAMARMRPQSNDYLLILGNRGRQTIRVTGGFFRTAPGSIRGAAVLAAKIARTHSIRVVVEDERF